MQMKKIRDRIHDVIQDEENSITYDNFSNINLNYDIHPVTGKEMTKDEFFEIAKKHNWTEEQIYNNLYTNNNG